MLVSLNSDICLWPVEVHCDVRCQSIDTGERGTGAPPQNWPAEDIECLEFRGVVISTVRPAYCGTSASVCAILVMLRAEVKANWAQLRAPLRSTR